MNSGKWTLFAIGYQCGFAYVIALLVWQLGRAVQGDVHILGLGAALLLLGALGWQLFKPYKERR